MPALILSALAERACVNHGAPCDRTCLDLAKFQQAIKRGTDRFLAEFFRQIAEP